MILAREVNMLSGMICNTCERRKNPTERELEAQDCPNNDKKVPEGNVNMTLPSEERHLERGIYTSETF